MIGVDLNLKKNEGLELHHIMGTSQYKHDHGFALTYNRGKNGTFWVGMGSKLNTHDDFGIIFQYLFLQNHTAMFPISN